MEEDARLELTGKELGSLNVYISSEEILQTSHGIKIAQTLEELFPQARIQFLIRTESKATQQVMDGEVHLALTTHAVPTEVFSKVIAKVEFKTCASLKHPLFKKYTPKCVR